MNHIYNIVWNQATACYQVVTEIARGPSKSKKKSVVAVLGTLVGMTSLPAFAGPTGGQVTAGSATIAQSGTATTINQTSAKAAIDWTRFSVGANESVRFNQPNASAITLNRVTGAEASSIMGSISANGQVFILNPNGVLFGAGAQVNVGGLTATTLGLGNANFMAGNYKFAGNGSGSVVNNGTIAIAPGGTLALMAPVVQNTGTLSAPGGSVLLAAAQGVTLTLQADGGLVAYTLDAGSARALVDNGGLIEVGGGHVVLTAKGVDAMSKAVVNHSGLIEAQTVGSKNGVIELLGDMQSGTVNVSGKLDASAPNADGKGGDGGFIETSAATVQVAETAQITTAAVAGKAGTWLIDPLDITINSGVASAISNSLAGGNVTISTFSTEATGNGDIFVNSAVNWSANKFTLNAGRNININANLNGSGTAKLALEYGQATTTGAGSDYVLGNGARVNLPAGQNFSTLQGSAGVVKNFTVITSLGAAGSTTGADLQGMNGNLTKNYALAFDIDASATAGWDLGKGFTPIGNTDNGGFGGEFHGLGHVITNLSINRPGGVPIGLFGYATGKVQDLGIENANVIAGNSYGNAAGILAGIMSGSIIRSHTTGSLKSITSVGSAGGLVGTLGALTGLVSQSYSTASVESSHAVGGLVGYFFGKIEDSYATGKIFNNTYSAGGLVGINNGEIVRSYSTGEVIGTASKGGLVGMQGRDRPATTTGSYWDTSTSKLTTSASGTGKTTAELQQQATYVGWDFVNTWRIVEGSSYPLLRALTQGTITITTIPLNVTASNVNKVYDGLRVNTLADLQALGFTVTTGNTLASGDALPGLGETGTGIWSGTLNINGGGNTWQGAVNAGDYVIRPSGISSQKYEIKYVDGSLAIKPLPVNVWANDQVLEQGGALQPYTYRVVNPANGTALPADLTPASPVQAIAYAGPSSTSNFGAYPISITQLNVNPNYSAAAVYGGTVLVKPLLTDQDLFGWSLTNNPVRESIRTSLNGNLPTYTQAFAAGSPWVLQPLAQSIYHDNRVGAPEAKFVHPDGREVVFDRDTKSAISAFPYAGTFNFRNNSDSQIYHYIFDVIGSPEVDSFCKNSPEICAQAKFDFFESRDIYSLINTPWQWVNPLNGSVTDFSIADVTESSPILFLSKTGDLLEAVTDIRFADPLLAYERLDALTLGKANKILKGVGTANKVFKGAGTALQIYGSAVVLKNSFVDAVNGTWSSGNTADIATNIIGYSPAKLLTAPAEISALAVSLAGHGRLSDGLALDLETAKGTVNGFLNSMELISKRLAMGDMTIEAAESKFNSEVIFYGNQLKELRDSYRDVGVALSLALTGNAAATDRVFSSIAASREQINGFDFSHIKVVAAAKLLSGEIR